MIKSRGADGKILPIPAEARFWASVQKSLGCWLWTGTLTKAGYGQLSVRGKSVLASRFAYGLLVGEIPEGIWVLHKCDTPACVRPEHLYLGTHVENMKDMVSRGRVAVGDKQGLRKHPERAARGAGHSSRTCPERVPRGERHGSAKLSEQIVVEIRRRYADGESQHQIAAHFGVSQPNVGMIVRRKTWRHV